MSRKPRKPRPRFYAVADSISLTEHGRAGRGFFVLPRDDVNAPIAYVGYGKPPLDRTKKDARRIALAIARRPHPPGTRLPHSYYAMDLRHEPSDRDREVPAWVFNAVLLLHPTARGFTDTIPLRPYCPVRRDRLNRQHAQRFPAPPEPCDVFDHFRDEALRRAGFTVPETPATNQTAPAANPSSLPRKETPHVTR